MADLVDFVEVPLVLLNAHSDRPCDHHRNPKPDKERYDSWEGGGGEKNWKCMNQNKNTPGWGRGGKMYEIKRAQNQLYWLTHED